MKTKILLILFCLTLLTSYAQKRNYLLYTDENVSRLKEQIKSNDAIKNNWNTQYKKAKALLKKDKLKSTDGLLLGLVYRMTGEEKFLTWAERLADYYLAQKDFVPSRLRDHGCEIIGGIGLLLAVESKHNPTKAKAYQAKLKHIFDTILETQVGSRVQLNSVSKKREKSY